MMIVNPYAKKKSTAPVSLAVASPPRPKAGSKPQIVTKTTPVVAASVQVAKAPAPAPCLPPAPQPPQPPAIKSAPHVKPKPKHTPTPKVLPQKSAAAALTLKPNKVSLKSQLKKQIQDLKRAKQAQIHRKQQQQLDLERKRQRELLEARRIKELRLKEQERNAKEQERLERERIRQEESARKQEEKQKRMEEKQKLEQERLRQKELKRLQQEEERRQQQIILKQQQQQHQQHQQQQQHHQQQQQQQHQRRLEMQRQIQVQQHYMQLQAMGHVAPFSHLAAEAATPFFQRIPMNHSMAQVTPSPHAIKAPMVPVTRNIGLVGADESSSVQAKSKSNQPDSKQETVVGNQSSLNKETAEAKQPADSSVANLESKFDDSATNSASIVVPESSSSAGQPPLDIKLSASPQVAASFPKNPEVVLPVESAAPPVLRQVAAIESSPSASVPLVVVPWALQDKQASATNVSSTTPPVPLPVAPEKASSSDVEQPASKVTSAPSISIPVVTATAPPPQQLQQGSPEPGVASSSIVTTTTDSHPSAAGPSNAAATLITPLTPHDVTLNQSSLQGMLQPWMPAAPVPQNMWQQPMAPTTPWAAQMMYGGQSASRYPPQSNNNNNINNNNHMMSPWMMAAAPRNTNPMATSTSMMTMMLGNSHGWYSAQNNPSMSQLPMTAWPQAHPKPIRSKPRAPKKPQFEAPERLVAALEPPSPFDHTHYLLSETIVIVRKQDENFGVNIKCEKRSVLVDPDWLKARNNPSASKPKPTDSPMVVAQSTKEEDSKTPNTPDATNPGTKILAKTSSENCTGVVDEKKQGDSSPIEEKSTEAPQNKNIGGENETPSNSSPLTAAAGEKKPVGLPLNNTLVEEKDQKHSSQSVAVIEEKKPLDSMMNDNVAEEKILANPTQSTDDVQEKSTTSKASGVEEDAKATSESFKENDPINVTGVSNDYSSALGSVKETGSASQSKKKRRRRANLGVMMVDDPSKQNSRHDGTGCLLLKPGDIILSINGQEVAGRTFPEACGIFSACKAEDGQLEIRATLVVARRKEIRAVPKPEVVPKPVQVKKVLPLPKTTTVATTSRDLSNLELAFLAKCVVDAGANPQRLFGQSTLEDHFRQATSVFHLATATDSVILPRSFETIKDKWGQITRKIERTMVEQAIEFWKSQWGLESESVRQLGMPFITDAHRSAMRNLPRPPKGCRCGREDHEFVHDPKCFLYSDLRRLAPDYDPRVGTTKQNLAASKFKNLNAVETAFKDRVVKLKTEKDSEEAEARFVAHMENIQVNKCKKAVFAPTLSAMILSTVFQLQDEFQEPEDNEESVEITKEMDIDSDDDSDSDEEDDVPLVALGKRKMASSSEQGTKKQKIDGPQLSYTFLAGLLSHISTTWGHVYREPSHEDYAW
jgi:hypothetical protein